MGAGASPMTDAPQPAGPDLRMGIAEQDLADGSMVVGHVEERPVLIARRGQELFAIDAHCTHYGGPLGEGLMVGETVRCPWHHACFSLRSGEALAAPALSPLRCWRVERENGRLLVRERAPSATHGQTPAAGSSAGPLPRSGCRCGRRSSTRATTSISACVAMRRRSTSRAIG